MDDIENCVFHMIEAIDNFNKKFDIKQNVDSEKYDCLLEYCESIDHLVQESSYDWSFEVKIDPQDRTIRVDIVGVLLVLKGVDKQRYIDLAERSVSYGFYNTSRCMLVSYFAFPSIWTKK